MVAREKKRRVVVVTIGCGESLKAACSWLLRTARANNCKAVMTFNGIRVNAWPKSDVQGLRKKWERLCARRDAAYRQSPEYHRRQLESEADIAAKQVLLDKLMYDLKSLDFSDDEAVLDWLAAVQAPMDRIGVVDNPQGVVAVFKDHGYVDLHGEDLKKLRKEDSHENAVYIISNALGCLIKVGCIPPVLLNFYDEWKKAFGKKVA